MRVPRFFLKSIDFIAGSMTSEDHPDELSDTSYLKGYGSWWMFYFFNYEADSFESNLTLLRGFLPILGF